MHRCEGGLARVQPARSSRSDSLRSPRDIAEPRERGQHENGPICQASRSKPGQPDQCAENQHHGPNKRPAAHSVLSSSSLASSPTLQTCPVTDYIAEGARRLTDTVEVAPRRSHNARLRRPYAGDDPGRRLMNTEDPSAAMLKCGAAVPAANARCSTNRVRSVTSILGRQDSESRIERVRRRRFVAARHPGARAMAATLGWFSTR
jgi:hypothetical protein